MAVNENQRDEVTFEITEQIGVLKSYPTGWSKELNLVSWNGNPAKYDIRDWDPQHEHMSRGITLHPTEAKKLCELLKPKHMSIRKIESQQSDNQPPEIQEAGLQQAELQEPPMEALQQDEASF